MNTNKKTQKDQVPEIENDTGQDTWSEVQQAAVAVESSTEVINCGCASTEEEGLMLLVFKYILFILSSHIYQLIN